jgi:WD40 repeat protein
MAIRRSGLTGAYQFDRTLQTWRFDNTGSDTVKPKKVVVAHQREVFALALNLLATIAVSGSRDGSVKVWELVSGELKESKSYTAHADEVLSVVLNAKGDLLATGGADKDRFVKLWNTSNGNLLKTLSAHSAGVRPLAFSPDDSHLASGSRDNTVII